MKENALDIIRIERVSGKTEDVNIMLKQGWRILEILKYRSILEGDSFYDKETYVLGLPDSSENQKLADELFTKFNGTYIISYESGKNDDQGRPLSNSSKPMLRNVALQYAYELLGKESKITGINCNQVFLMGDDREQFIKDARSYCK